MNLAGYGQREAVLGHDVAVHTLHVTPPPAKSPLPRTSVTAAAMMEQDTAKERRHHGEASPGDVLLPVLNSHAILHCRVRWGEEEGVKMDRH